MFEKLKAEKILKEFEVVVSWTLSKRHNDKLWQPAITIGYKGEEVVDHLCIPAANLSKIISEMKLQIREATVEAAIKNIEDNPPAWLRIKDN
jgi:hypothetical protein